VVPNVASSSSFGRRSASKWVLRSVQMATGLLLVLELRNTWIIWNDKILGLKWLELDADIKMASRWAVFILGQREGSNHCVHYQVRIDVTGSNSRLAEVSRSCWDK